MAPMCYQFEQFLLDRELGTLIGPAGEVRLRPQTLSLLEVLVENAPRILSTDELIDQGWDIDYVSVAAIRQAISELRQALGDSASSPRIVETVHRRGYRFIAPVKRREASGAEEAPEEDLLLEPDNSGPDPRVPATPVVATPATPGVATPVVGSTSGASGRRGWWVGSGLLALMVALMAWRGPAPDEQEPTHDTGLVDPPDALTVTARQNPLGIHPRRGELAEAQALVESLEQNLAQMDMKHRGSALRERAIRLGEEGRGVESLASYGAAEAIFRELGDRTEEASLLNSKARFLLQIGEGDEARSALERAIELSRAADFRRGLIVALCLRARVAASGARTALAHGFIEEAMKLSEDAADPRLFSLWHRSLGDVLRAEGNLEGAREQYLQASEIGDGAAESYARLGLGQIARARQRFDLARSHVKAALAEFRQLGNVPGQLVARCDLGDLELARGDWKAAEAAFRTVAGEARALSLEILHGRARAGLAEVARAQSAEAP